MVARVTTVPLLLPGPRTASVAPGLALTASIAGLAWALSSAGDSG